ncbi:MAG TPA: hypothetical protein VLA12_23530, partial [Planctomycetaceae bacterium]|nr:hypothetical protein [Planctomycetaceae bacterium]
MTAPSPPPDPDSSKLMTDQRRSIFEHLGTGIREFFRWLILIGIFGLGLAGISTALLADNFVYAAIVFTITLAETLAIGILLSGKRAIFRTVLAAIQDGKPLRKIVRKLFDQIILGPEAESEIESKDDPEVEPELHPKIETETKLNSGSKPAVGRAIEKIPFAEAERRMNEAVSGFLKSKQDSNRLRDRLKSRAESRLLKMIQKTTLARFRKQESETGEIDLKLVRA